MVLLITYDLKRPVQNYESLHEEIKRGGTWWHHLESTWIIETSESPQQVYGRLVRHIDQNDRLLIIEVKRNYWGWLTEKAWEWLNGRTFG